MIVYTGISGIFMVVCADNFLNFLVQIIARFKPSEKYKNLFPAGWAVDLPIGICLKIIYDALS